jgi:hypothetical protein
VILTDPIYGENVIIEELPILHELYQGTFDRQKAWIKTQNGFACPTLGSIMLPLQVGRKKLDVSFSIIPKMDQFYVKLGYSWLHSMEAIL